MTVVVVVSVVYVWFFFFQAEDGIRDLVRSRGLGDVYKRQLLKRHGLSDVLGGAYVFPGGKLDASDAQLDAAQHLSLIHI